MNYKTFKLTEQIIAIQAKDPYERAMLFCRIQEFYESPSKRFRQQKFSIWDYFKWYSRKFGKGCFSYPRDFTGFNVPMIVAKKCYELNETETPYDETMKDIIERYFVDGQKRYIIGTQYLKGSTFNHEMCHAMYYVDEDYRSKADELTDSIPKADLKSMRRNLSEMGYSGTVFKDEVQAYMATEVNKKVTKNVLNPSKMHKKYNSLFRKMKPLI